MIVKTVPICTSQTQAVLTTYFQENSPEMGMDRVRPMVLICPGGGYGFLSDREAEPVALRMCGMGFHACVLRYSIAPATFPSALWEVAASVAWLREHAGEYHIDPEKIVVCGFSAGAHLAGSIGVFWNREFLSGLTGLSAAQMRPDRLILCYPVVTSGKYAHMGSFENLLGKDCTDEEKRAFVSLERQVTPDMPKTFLWHTFADRDVPVENSLLMAEAMRRAGVPFELHIFPDGAHGLSLADEQSDNGTGEQIVPECAVWPALAADWIKRD